MRLRRSLRGDAPARADTGSITTLLANWPQRLADQRLIRESLAVLEPLNDALAYLYPVLFRNGPHLRGLFPDSLDAQRHRLAWSMRQLIEALDQPEVIVPIFEELGRAHRKLGVRTVHYQPFGNALIEALQTYAGAAWRPEYSEAWSRAYRFMAEVMSRGAESDLSVPPYLTATVTDHWRRDRDLAILRVQPAQQYSYLAGQYATVGSPQLPHTWRSYSMANPPSDDGRLEFHVRATSGGRLSDLLVNRTTVGDVLWLGSARGTMILDPESSRKLLLVAGGTGLAPIRALLETVSQRSAPPETWLFVGARTADDLYDQVLLNSYANRYSWLRLVTALSEEVAHPHEYGTLVDVVQRYGDWAGHIAYLSGPPAMVAGLRTSLVDLGVDPAHIRYDPY